MPSLSHSACECWSQCQRRYFLERILRVPRAPSAALVLGSAVHAVLEADGARIIRGLAPFPLEWLESDLWSALARQLERDDSDGLLEPDRGDMERRGEAILRAYVEHVQPQYRPESVEESFDVPITGLSDGLTDWRFTGRIDARTTLADGRFAVLDFKCVSKPWLPGLEHSKPQATAYTWALEVTGGDPVEAVVFVVFPAVPDGRGGYTCEPQYRVTTREADQLTAYSRYLHATARQIERAAEASGEYPASTGPLCGWCSCLGRCSEGRDWLAKRGRRAMVPVVRQGAALNVGE